MILREMNIAWNAAGCPGVVYQDTEAQGCTTVSDGHHFPTLSFDDAYEGLSNVGACSDLYLPIYLAIHNFFSQISSS